MDQIGAFVAFALFGTAMFVFSRPLSDAFNAQGPEWTRRATPRQLQAVGVFAYVTAVSSLFL